MSFLGDNHHIKSQRKWLKNGREVSLLKEVSTLQMVKDSDERLVKTKKNRNKTNKDLRIYRIYSIKCPLLYFWTLRVGAFSRLGDY